MEEFEIQLRELYPHSPLGWDSDELVNELYTTVGNTSRLFHMMGDDLTWRGLAGRRVAAIGIFATWQYAKRMVTVLRRFVGGAGEVDVEVDIKTDEDIGMDEYEGLYLLIHTAKQEPSPQSQQSQ